MKRVRLRELGLAAYRGVAPDADLHELDELGSRLRGARIRHLNATSYGGGVAELLQSLVPLERDIGLDSEWWTINAPAAFFQTTKRLHNALQGMPVDISDSERALFRATSRRQAAKVPHADVLFAHDPQVVALRHDATGRSGRWAWRCHIDLTTSHAAALSFVLPYVNEHDVTVFTLPAFVPSTIDARRVRIMAPAIDPLSEKNRPLDAGLVRDTLVRFGVDPEAPLMLQVARFDPWKDPLGVIDAYRMAREDVPNLQLALVGALADDDPEGVTYLDRARGHAAGDRSVRLLTNVDGVEAREVNAFQRAASVSVLKSIREGFGLTVSESCWKGVPVVGGNVGGIPLQIEDGVTGYLVGDIETCAARVVEIVRDGGLRERLGSAGREKVRESFLTTRLLRDHLRLYAELLGR